MEEEMEEEMKDKDTEGSEQAEEKSEDDKKEEIMSKADIQAKIDEIKGKIMILEWDKEKNQLNAGKAVYLENLKKEMSSLQEKLS